MCDNNSITKLLTNPIMHGRCKHIEVKFHFFGDLTKDGIIKMCYFISEDQLADVLTKYLKLDFFCTKRTRLEVCELQDN